MPAFPDQQTTTDDLGPARGLAEPGRGEVSQRVTGAAGPEGRELSGHNREEMSAAPSAGVGDNEVTRLFERRAASVDEFAGHAGTVAAACHDMAVRFHQGAKLVVFGTGASSTDALHVAVEFVHPVIVGKRALPAISLTTDVATVTGIAEQPGIDAIFSYQLRYLAAPSDIRIRICAHA